MKEQNPAGKVKIKAVIFDYGRVLSLPQPPSTVERMAEICRVPVETFRKGYWDFRLAYDRGDLSVNEYWKSRAQTFEVNLSAEQIAKIVRVDCESWSHLNPIMVEWVQQLRAMGARLALLSNMPLELKDYLVANLDLFSYFDHLVFSCDVRRVKPEPEIYQHCLDLLKLPPNEVLFLDDKPENVQGATQLGIHSLLFDLAEGAFAQIRDHFDLPLPASQLSAGSVAR